MTKDMYIIYKAKLLEERLKRNDMEWRPIIKKPVTIHIHPYRVRWYRDEYGDYKQIL